MSYQDHVKRANLSGRNSFSYVKACGTKCTYHRIGNTGSFRSNLTGGGRADPMSTSMDAIDNEWARKLRKLGVKKNNLRLKEQKQKRGYPQQWKKLREEEKKIDKEHEKRKDQFLKALTKHLKDEKKRRENERKRVEKWMAKIRARKNKNK